MNHTKLLETVIVLGVIFLAVFFVIISARSVPIGGPVPPYNFVSNETMWFLLTSGTFCLIGGVVGSVRHHFESERGQFAVLIVISIPILIIAILYLVYLLVFSTTLLF